MCRALRDGHSVASNGPVLLLPVDVEQQRALEHVERLVVRIRMQTCGPPLRRADLHERVGVTAPLPWDLEPHEGSVEPDGLSLGTRDDQAGCCGGRCVHSLSLSLMRLRSHSRLEYHREHVNPI